MVLEMGWVTMSERDLGYEVDLLYLACLAALVLGGSGPMAIDGYLRRKG